MLNISLLPDQICTLQNMHTVYCTNVHWKIKYLSKNIFKSLNNRVGYFSNFESNTQHITDPSIVWAGSSCNRYYSIHRRRIKTEEKVNVVPSVWGEEFIKFLAALAVLFERFWIIGWIAPGWFERKGWINPIVQNHSRQNS